MAKPKTVTAPTATPDTVTLVAVIKIAGTDYKVGDTLDFDGKRVTVEAKKQLSASPKSGLASGIYPVVSTMIGDRKAIRAIVDGKLYPVRKYGTPDETIAKNREEHGRRSTKAAAPAADGGHDRLSAAAEKLVSRYLALKPEAGRAVVLSDLVVTHLAPAVEKLEGLELAIKQLPHDLLLKLGEADEATRERVFALLRGK